MPSYSKRQSLQNIMKKYISITLILAITFSCSDKIEKVNFNFTISEPCMILNYELDNTVEGNYILTEEFLDNDSSLIIKNLKKLSLDSLSIENWVIGWGSNKPLFDAGVENIRQIKKIDFDKNKIFLGKLIRGTGFPEKKQRVVLWNTAPSGFKNHLKKPIINPKIWPQFSGESIGFSSIEYDSLLRKWVMIVNEVDISKIQIYAAVSDDLVNWDAANEGAPILSVSDFKNCIWAGIDKSGKNKQTPFVSDIVRNNNIWYLFLDGYSSDGKRHIGMATSKTSLIGPFEISKNPILSPGRKGDWNDESVFYAKVKKYKDGFIMFYDGRNSKGYERVGMAFSNDLTSWTNSDNNPVLDQHYGWRSSVGCSEPNYIEIRGDSIFLMVAGVKKFKMGAWHHYITKRMYLDKSGNVDDAQLGVYLSTDGGNTFNPHINNPIFVNDYSNKYENEHMGGNFKLIQTDTAEFIIYQAKSSYEGLKYNILLRMRKKK
jgi:hypothetical protein